MAILLNHATIEKRRMELGLTKKELARRAGISPGRYTQILNAARQGKPPFAPTAKEIATALGLSPEQVLIEREETTV